jgi:hypothetical protein
MIDPGSRKLSLLVLVLVAAVVPAPAAAQPRGDIGESCRARSDCLEGLRCVEQVCQPACTRSEDCGTNQVCRQGRCVEVREGLPPPSEAKAPAPKGGWADFTLGGTHLFGGITLAPGMTGYWVYGGPVEVEPAFFFALRLGLLFDRTELALEIAPKTWVWDFDDPQRSSFSLNASIGGLIKVAKHAYWPLRFGLGFTAGDLAIKDVYMQGRVDLVGIVYQYGHLLFEVNLPSTRFHSEFRNIGIWAWLFNLSITYVI